MPSFWQAVKTCMTIIHRHLTGIVVGKTGLASTGSHTCFLNFYNWSIGNLVINLCKLSTGIAVVKTVLTILYRLSTRFAVVKMAWRT